MKFYADVHIHSHYSRATSKNLDLEHLALWAQLKGINVVGTGDFVHPLWLKELKVKLEPAEPGLFKLKKEFATKTARELPGKCQSQVRFLLSCEISNIYKRMDKVRKVHNLLFAPSFEAVDKIQSELSKIGNISSDGRPILGLDSRDLLEITLNSDPFSYLVPAHIWTPWFSALGSKGGFDKMTDCFADLSKYIFAVETGLSSDPLMNWRLGQLDPYVLISNSDAHSPQKLAREATIYDTEFSYFGIYRALSERSDPGLVGTLEFFPEEGKYHYDGHSVCKQRLHPEETIKNHGLCPACGKPVVVGVMSRVEQLADYPQGRKSPNRRPYDSLIPLPEIIADAKGMGVNSQGVQKIFFEMLYKLGNEISILREFSLAEISRASTELIAEGIGRMRQGKVEIAPGYDGEYGVIKVFTEQKRLEPKEQLTLFV